VGPQGVLELRPEGVAAELGDHVINARLVHKLEVVESFGGDMTVANLRFDHAIMLLPS